MKIIEVNNLSKTFNVKIKEKGLKGSLKSIIKPKYKIVNAVNNVSFSVDKGEIIAFIGPNGAGGWIILSPQKEKYSKKTYNLGVL